MNLSIDIRPPEVHRTVDDPAALAQALGPRDVRITLPKTQRYLGLSRIPLGRPS
jgi:hypothetical protein